MTCQVCPGSHNRFYQPDIGLHMVGDLGEEKGRGPGSERGEDYRLVGQVPVHCRPARQVLQERPGHPPAHGLGRAAAGPSLIRAEQGVRAFGKEGQRGPRLWCGVVIEEADIGVEAPPGEARLAGCRHALTDLPLLQVRSEGQAPICSVPRRSGIVRGRSGPSPGSTVSATLPPPVGT